MNWEYMLLADVCAIDPRKMCELGAEGWELVSVCAQFNKQYAYFKRSRE